MRPIVDISEWFDDSCDLFINNAFDDDNPHAQSDATKICLFQMER